MYGRIVILSAVILAALCGLTCLGYHAVTKWAQGLEGTRLGEFAEVAEQVRKDVKRKLDDFIRSEQERQYTDYLYYYVPENVENIDREQQQMPLMRSPLGDRLKNGFAYGYFQIDADRTISAPYFRPDAQQPVQQPEHQDQIQAYFSNVRRNVLPALSLASGRFTIPSNETLQSMVREDVVPDGTTVATDSKKQNEERPTTKGAAPRQKAYVIEPLQGQSQQAKVIRQQRDVSEFNTSLNTSNQLAQSPQQMGGATPQQGGSASQVPQPVRQEQQAEPVVRDAQTQQRLSQPSPQPAAGQAAGPPTQRTSDEAQVSQQPGRDVPADTVQVRIEPFVPLVVGGGGGRSSVFASGQVFLLRHVQVGDRHFLQGFQLNEAELVTQVEESARRFKRAGMIFDLGRKLAANPPAVDAGSLAYTAMLDFGFGELILRLGETDPAWIAKQIRVLHTWYFSIIAVVSLAVIVALVSLWHNVRAQMVLVDRKDEFLSAVSHELRTPLTSIRMYSEMLEKKWVKSEDKVAEYYRSMRRESERLTRLIENVLDFSRLQRGRKQYAFRLGDLNQCIAEVAQMMQPYAAEHGFRIETDFGSLGQTVFDRDAVTQIVVNLIDNAVKYARSAEDKTITVRTRDRQPFALIEVEDHGPGIPHRQRKKVFEQFYRYGPQPAGPATAGTAPQTSGTGLGLALVKGLAEAHKGFVEILSAKPAGTVLRVGLAASR